MTKEKDKWPPYFSGQREHLHALGVISLCYNQFEAMWSAVLAHYAGETTAEFLLAGRVADDRRIATVLQYARTHEKESEILSRIEHVAVAYAVCSENRNILMHSHQNFFAQLKMSLDNQENKLALMKRSKAGKSLHFTFDLKLLRRVADDMHAGLDYLYVISERLLFRDLWEKGKVVAPNYREWPKKALKPIKLVPAEIVELG
jgi:hypothetical protein